MLQYKCKSCGGQVDIGDSGSMVCPFCGSKSFMSDADYKGNEYFRQKLLKYVLAKIDEKEFDYSKDVLWEARHKESFEMANSKPLNIEYMVKYAYQDLDVYVAKESVVYIFSDEAEAAKFKRGLQQISFPEADSKLPRCFPALKMELNLKGGRKVLVFLRRPGFYPAELFSPWPSEHLAWVISRMENLCCAFEYSDIQHTGISPESIFVNPITHEGAIFGDWRQVSDKAGSKDLEDLRKTAKLLASNTRKPVQMYDFLNSKPTSNSFEDFKKWDTVIEEGFGGHNFIKM